MSFNENIFQKITENFNDKFKDNKLKNVESFIKPQAKNAGIDDKTFSDFLKWFKTTAGKK